MNDLTLDNMREIEEEFKFRYLRSVCDLQLTYARRRNTDVGATRLQAWIRSTYQKDAFAWAMVRAKCVRVPASQSEICLVTNISRQSVSDMIKTCVAEGWVTVFCDQKEVEASEISHCKGTLKYEAGEEMMLLAGEFVERHINTTADTYMNKNWYDLMAIRRVRGVVQ